MELVEKIKQRERKSKLMRLKLNFMQEVMAIEKKMYEIDKELDSLDI